MALELPILGNDSDLEEAKQAARLNAPKLLAPGSRAYNLVLGATSQPRMPIKPVLGMPKEPDLGSSAELIRNAGGMTLAPTPAPRRPVLDAAPDLDVPTIGNSTPIGGILGNTRGPARPPGRGTSEDWEGQRLGVGPRPEYHGAKKFFDILGSVAAPTVMERTGLGTLGWESRFNKAEAADKEAEASTLDRYHIEEEQGKAQFNTPEKRRAYIAQHPDEFEGASDFEKNDFALTGKFPQREPPVPKEADKKIDEYVNEDGKRVLTFQRTDGSVYDRVGSKTQGKQVGHTSPFEAFAYGTPEEKKAAQDFLAFEKRMGAQYQRPTEAEFRYSLYQRDPQGYKAVFGDKGATADRAQATKMFTFFEKQREAIQKDFMLDENEKAQQLKDIEELERPYRDVIAGGGGGGNAGERVSVIAPDGTPGTIPRSQVAAAKRKGYRVAE